MKFDIFKWQEVKIDAEYTRKSGLLHVMCSKACAVFVSAQGVEVLAGVGQDINIQIKEPFQYRIESEEGARAFVESPPSQFHETVGEVFTNLDRKPEESGSVLAVRQAMRELQLQQRDMLASLRSERQAVERLKGETAEPPASAEPVNEVEPETTDEEAT
jgi:hypothetical protein